VVSFYVVKVEVGECHYPFKRPLLLNFRIGLACPEVARVVVESKKDRNGRVNLGDLLALFASVHTTYSTKRG